MQQLNVYGCRRYLVSVPSNQSFKLLSIVIIRVPFEYAMIQFKSREPNTLRSICTTSDSLCMMAPFTYSSEQVVDIFTKVFCEKKFSNLKSLLGIADHAMKHDWWKVFQILFSCPCLREDFPTGFFPLSPWLYGHEVCKRWLSLASRTYKMIHFSDILHKLNINLGC